MATRLSHTVRIISPDDPDPDHPSMYVDVEVADQIGFNGPNGQEIFLDCTHPDPRVVDNTGDGSGREVLQPTRISHMERLANPDGSPNGFDAEILDAIAFEGPNGQQTMFYMQNYKNYKNGDPDSAAPFTRDGEITVFTDDTDPTNTLRILSETEITLNGPQNPNTSAKLGGHREPEVVFKTGNGSTSDLNASAGNPQPNTDPNPYIKLLPGLGPWLGDHIPVKQGMLWKIVNVKWGGGWYVVIEATAEYNDGDPVPSCTITLPTDTANEIVYTRESNISIPPASSGDGDGSVLAVYLATQEVPTINTFNDVFIPCFGHFPYGTVDGFHVAGHSSAADAVADPLPDTGMSSAFYISHQAIYYTAMPSTLAASPGFGGFTVGAPFDSTTAPAFAAALGAQVGEQWVGPATFTQRPDGCADSIFPGPVFTYFPVWAVGTLGGSGTPGPARFMYEKVVMIKIPKILDDPQFTITLTNTPATHWATSIATVFDSAGHTLDGTNTAANGRVYLPIDPDDDERQVVSGFGTGDGIYDVILNHIPSPADSDLLQIVPE